MDAATSDGTESQRQAAAVRKAAGLFRLRSRGLIEVAGRDAPRWLEGMISSSVKELVPDGPASGTYALLLSPIGRIVADLHVLARPEGFWLELERAAVDAVIARLERYVIADDVALADVSEAWARLALEGPAAADILALDPVPPAYGAGPLTLGGVDCRVAARSLCGGAGFQLFAPAAGVEAVVAALRTAGAGAGLVEAGEEALEILRVEGGVPRLGRELDEEVLPPEARLDHAVSTTKGCYTGQEVVARIRSRGQVKHLLVGLAFRGEPPAPGAVLRAGERKVGEVTSVVRSPAAGPIGLGFVVRDHEAPGTELAVDGGSARVAALPFVA